MDKFHTNEGHAALLALELFAEELKRTPDEHQEAMERVKRMCVFTTYTPVPAGHDQFSLPLATKNVDLPRDLCRQAMADAVIALSRPVLVQVSRFDPWKDPLGVIQAYRLVKAEMPGVQQALIGAMAGDDTEGWELLGRVEEKSANDPDMYVFTNLGGMGSIAAGGVS